MSKQIDGVGVLRLSSSSEIVGFTSSSVNKKVSEGKVFIAGINRSISVADNIRIHINNPADSGKNLYLFKITVYSDSNVWVDYYKNSPTPTVGVANVTPFNLNQASTATSVMSVVGGTGAAPAVSGSVVKLPNASRATSGGSLLLEIPSLVIPPGVSMEVLMSFTTAATGAANFYWYEE